MDARGRAQDVADTDADEAVDVLQRIGRYGYVVYGLVHVVLAVLAVRVGLGGSSQEASTSGAMQTLAQQPFGLVLVWSVGVGMALLVLWQGMEAALDPDDEGGKARLRAAGKALAYGVVAAAALRLALNRGGGGGSEEEGLTSRLLSLPAGRLLVAAVGLGILVVAVYHVQKGLRATFLRDVETRDLSARQRAGVLWTGRVGYVAKGLAFAVIGVLFCVAAWTADSDDAGGLDDALASLREAPFGSPLIIAIGLGFAAFGLYCLTRARSAGDLTGYAGR